MKSLLFAVAVAAAQIRNPLQLMPSAVEASPVAQQRHSIAAVPEMPRLRSASTQAAAQIRNPILFVTQVPVPGDFTTVASTFGNQVPAVQQAPRGGDLWIRYPDGATKNLTRAAGFGRNGMPAA